jgi:lauroyl/myristoyl acyltransferase
MTMLKDAFLWFYWYPFRLLVQKIPTKSAYAMAKIAGLVLFYINGQRRRALREILSDIFTGLIKEKNFKKVLQNSFVIYCQNELEVLLFSNLNRYNIRDFVKCSGLENLDKALSGGKGAMLLFAHFGANQMIMPAIGYSGYKMSQVSAPATVWVEKLPNRRFSSMAKQALKLRWTQELSLPVTHINIFGSLKNIFICLKRNEVLGIAMDGGGGATRVGIDFLGNKIFLSTGAIEIAMKTRCTVLPTFMVRGKNGTHTMMIEPPLNMISSDDKPDAVTINMAEFVKRFEVYVASYPDHYLNFIALRTFMEPFDGFPFITKKEETDLKSSVNESL